MRDGGGEGQGIKVFDRVNTVASIKFTRPPDKLCDTKSGRFFEARGENRNEVLINGRHRNSDAPSALIYGRDSGGGGGGAKTGQELWRGSAD